MITYRNIALYVVLSIVTCGIFGLYWFVVLTDDTNRAVNDPNTTSGGVALLLTIVTCGIYGLYWAYKQGQKLDYAEKLRGNSMSSDRGIIYLLLELFGLGIVAWALMQDSLNKMADNNPPY